MKVKDILQEAWIDKFQRIQNEIKDLSIDDLENYLYTKLNVDAVIDIDETLPPNTHGDGGIESKPSPDGTYELNIKVGPVDPGTKISEIDGLLSAIRHELAHLQQLGGVNPIKDKNEKLKKYISGENDSEYTEHILQELERSNHSLDLAHQLALLDITPEKFEEIAKQLQDSKKDLLNLASNAILDTTSIDQKQIINSPDRYNAAIRGISNKIKLVIEVLNGSDKKLKTKLKTFLKNTKKNFRKAKGYQKRKNTDHS